MVPMGVVRRSSHVRTKKELQEQRHDVSDAWWFRDVSALATCLQHTLDHYSMIVHVHRWCR